jgi:hypothetical protein
MNETDFESSVIVAKYLNDKNDEYSRNKNFVKILSTKTRKEKQSLLQIATSSFCMLVNDYSKRKDFESLMRIYYRQGIIDVSKVLDVVKHLNFFQLFLYSDTNKDYIFRKTFVNRLTRLRNQKINKIKVF